MPEVFESDDVRLAYDGHGDRHPLAGGVLRFRMPRLADVVAATGGFSQLCYRLEQLEMWSLQVTLHPLGDRTEVVIYGDLRRGAQTNVKLAKGLTVGVGAVALAVTLAACVSGGLGALALAPALAAATGTGGATALSS